MTVIDKIMNDLERAFWENVKRVPAGMDYVTWKWMVSGAVDAIAWYIQTGRASMQEVRAIENCRLYWLVRHMATKSEGNCRDSMIVEMKRYSGYRKQIGKEDQQ